MLSILLKINHYYVWHYAACSLAFLSLIFVVCLRQKKMPTIRGRIFKWLITFTMLTVFLDMFTGIMLQESGNWHLPKWSLELAHICFFTCAQSIPPIYLVYSCILSKKIHKLHNLSSLLYFIPLLVMIVIIFASLWTTPTSGFGMFHIEWDSATNSYGYCKGPTNSLQYFVSAAYISAVFFIVASAKNIKKEKKFIICFFMICSFVSMILTLLVKDGINDGYKFTSTGTAIAIILLYFEIEAPGDYIDRVSGAFSNAAFQEMAEEYIDHDIEFSTVILCCTNHDSIQQQFGLNAINDYTKDVYKLLCEYYDRNCIYRYHHDSFAIIMKNITLSENAIRNLFYRLNPVFSYEDVKITNNMRIGYIPSSCAKGDFNKFYTIVDANADQLKSLKYSQEFMCYTDDSFLQFVELRQRQQRALEKAIEQDSITVFYQPIHDGNNKIVAFEALARLFDDEIGPVPPDVFVTLAEKNGLILRLGDQIFNKIVKFASSGILEKYGVDHISVNLSMAQCMQEDLCERYKVILDKNHVKYDKIIFEITETEATDAMSIVKNLVDDFKAYGFKFSLDDFGSGYANFNYIFQLPFNIVKIDKSLLDVSQKDDKQKLLFRNVVKIIKDLKLECICEGVEREDQVEMLNTLGVTHHQGFFYSKPLCTEDLKIYLDQKITQPKSKIN